MAAKKPARKPEERRPKGWGTVYHVKNRKGVIIAYYAELEINGRSERRRAPDREAAEARLEELRDLKRRGVNVGEVTQPLSAWLATWYIVEQELHTQGEIAYGTLQTYYKVIYTYLTPKLGHIRLNEVKQETIQEFLWALRREIRDYYAGKNVERVAAGKPPYRRLPDGASTVLRCAVVLKMALALAEDRGLIAKSPYQRIKLPRAPKRKVPAPRAEHVARFLLAVRGHRWEALMTIYALLGFRQGEGTGLRWSDYDPQARTLAIVQQVQRRDKRGEEKTHMAADDPKNDTSARVVPALDSICALLDALRPAQLELRMRRADTWVANDLVFCNRDGMPLWPGEVEKEFRRLWDGAGLPAETILHDLRKGVATLLDEADVTETQKAAILGHKKATQTQEYITPRIEAMRRVLERAAARVFAEMKKQEGRVG
jgi:integrase